MYYFCGHFLITVGGNVDYRHTPLQDVKAKEVLRSYSQNVEIVK
jgi:hypothetical protein